MTSGHHRIELNAAISRRAFLAGLETAFPDYGGPEMFRWYAARRLSGLPAPDRLGVFDTEGCLVSGLVVNYRRLAGPAGFAARAGILCNAWTVPEARGGGLFTALVQRASDRCKAQGCQVLMAFVTETNASFRAFQAMGVKGAPTAYCVADAAGDDPAADGGLVRDAEDDLAAWRPAEAPGRFRFGYTDEDWMGQFVLKPAPVYRLALPSGGYAIVEEQPTTIRLNAAGVADPDEFRQLLHALRGHAARSGRAVFGFTADPAAMAAYADAGFRTLPGRLILMDIDLAAAGASLDRLLQAGWDLQSGDRV